MSDDEKQPEVEYESKFSIKLKFVAEVDKAAVQERMETLASQLAGGQALDLQVRKSSDRKQLTDEEKEQIIELRKQNESYQSLADRFGVSTAAVNKVLRDAGLTRQWMSDEAKAKLEAERKAKAEAEAEAAGDAEEADEAAEADPLDIA